jgi:hypothetical protein
MKTTSLPATAAARSVVKRIRPAASQQLLQVRLVDRRLPLRQLLDLRRIVIYARHGVPDIRETSPRGAADIARSDYRNNHDG